MKIRTGFVSNSSSTSFTCEICGRTEQYYDSQSFEDFDFVRCENEHGFCVEELIGEVETREDENYGGDCVLEKNCPICQFKAISNSEVGKYIQKEHGITREEAFDDIKKINKRRKVLKDFDYIKYSFNKLNITEDVMLQGLKERFFTYNKFMDYIRS